MPLSHNVIPLTASLDQANTLSQKDKDLILDIAVSRAIALTGENRSEPYRKGTRATLARVLFSESDAPSPYPEGSPSHDAWLSGHQLGNQIAGFIHRHGWRLFLETTAA